MALVFSASGAPRMMRAMASVMEKHHRVQLLDEALEAVVAGGGQVTQEPLTNPSGERVARCVDPGGASFGLHSR